MTKKIFAIITGLFLICSLAMLLAMNSFFRENVKLLNEQKKLATARQKLQKEVTILKKKIPPEPKGAVLEKIIITPVSPSTAEKSPTHTVSFWVVNPTKETTPVIQGIIAAQQINANGAPRWNYWSIQIAPIPPGERRSVVTNPLTLGAPGRDVEVTVNLWDQPGIAKTRYQLPEIQQAETGPEGAGATQNLKQPVPPRPTPKPEPKPKSKPTPPPKPAPPPETTPPPPANPVPVPIPELSPQENERPAQ